MVLAVSRRGLCSLEHTGYCGSYGVRARLPGQVQGRLAGPPDCGWRTRFCRLETPSEVGAGVRAPIFCEAQDLCIVAVQAQLLLDGAH